MLFLNKHILTKVEIIKNKDRQLCVEIKTTNTITSDLKEKFLTKINDFLTISDFEKEILRNIVKEKCNITTLKEIEKSGKMFPYKQIYSPLKMYKNIFPMHHWSG